MFTTTTSSVLAVVLISQMGSPSYRQRERAAHTLSQVAPAVLPYLKAAEANPNPEIARRSKAIVRQYYVSMAEQLAGQARPSAWPRTPWLDMLPPDHPDRHYILSHYLDQAQKEIGRHGPPEWDDYRLATRLYLRNMFMEQTRPEQVQQLLDRMADVERSWIEQNGGRYNPPVPVPLSKEF